MRQHSTGCAREGGRRHGTRGVRGCAEERREDGKGQESRTRGGGRAKPKPQMSTTTMGTGEERRDCWNGGGTRWGGKGSADWLLGIVQYAFSS